MNQAWCKCKGKDRTGRKSKRGWTGQDLAASASDGSVGPVGIDGAEPNSKTVTDPKEWYQLPPKGEQGPASTLSA